MASILVVDGSASVRETLRIVLGTEHQVDVVPSLDAVSTDHPRPELVVLGVPPLPRDARALEAVIARVVPDVPLLLLQSAADVHVQRLAPPNVPVEILPKPFDAHAIRRAVRALLRSAAAAVAPGDGSAAERQYLEAPFLPRSAAALLRNVLAADVRVVGLEGEIGTGAARVAHALHVVRGRRGPYVTIDAARTTPGTLTRRIADAGGEPGATVFVANLDEADRLVQSDVALLVEAAHAADDGPRVVVAYAGDLAAAVADGRFAGELAYAVTTVPIHLTPLRERPEDVPELVEILARDLCARYRLEPVQFEIAAIERLQQYLWFGNVIELEAVIARTLVVQRPSVVATEQILFLPESTPRAAAVRVASAPPLAGPAPAGNGLAALDLEVVLGELAHELRNPMVTIKTFAQHLDSVLADPEVRARFAGLTTEAIGRMDELLETLLDFARFRAPTLRAVDVQQLMDRALAEYGAELQRRHVEVERNGIGTAPIDADEAQVLFAFRSLCRGLVPDLSAHTVLKVRGAERGVELQVRTEASIAARLAAWVERAAGDGETPPLMWALASALLARNGATLAVRKGDAESTVIRVEWPPRN
jgi:DNA-binding NtrC family response regulator